MTTYYGNYGKEEDYPIAARIWGHRLRAGQHWIEYMLEFLSVLSGYGYQLGQWSTEYEIPRRLGLRRFVFYDEREKTRDSRDSRATVELCTHLCKLLAEVGNPSDEDLLDQVRSLLRSFSAIEETRSWYAKSLFPVHEEFLLWEALRKGSTLKEYSLPAEDLPTTALDQGVEFRARNFFARGGEIYYLIVSAGTERDLQRRARISQRLRHLLTEHNQALGRLARVIDNAWSELVGNNDDLITGKPGWLPDPDCALYEQIAVDLDIFLDNNLDSLECLELLAHLIGFHIVSYIYHRAHPASDPEGHVSGSCLDACRPELLIDLLGNQDGSVIRACSASLLREQEDRQIRRARELIEQQMRVWANSAPGEPDRLIDYLEDESRHHFMGKTRTTGKYNIAVKEIRTQYGTSTDRETIVKAYSDKIFEVLSTDFRRNFLGVHRKVGRAIGLIAPSSGPQVRFVIDDTLLKTMVMAVLRQGDQISFGKLLDKLYQRYGIVVGPGEAHAAGLVDRMRINEEYFTRNREALLVRMQRAGLVTQYSDATALVHRHVRT